jgi:hypothetical protein
MKNKQFGPSLYHVTDKNIFDAFCHKSIKHSDMVEYLSERGIFVSKHSTKTDLMEYASRLPHDYFNRQFLSELLETKSRREKTASSIVKASVSTIDLNNACKMIETDNKGNDERISFSCSGDKATITVTHTVIDYTKTELKQKEHKTFTIDIINSGSSLDIRRPANQKSNEISDKFIEKLSEIKSEPLEVDVITLEAFTNPEARTYFFRELMKSLEGLSFDDVRIVDVHHDIEPEDEDDDDDDNVSANLGSSFVGHIKKAVLDGDGVLNSAEFKQLHDSGFFISRVVWSVVQPGTQGDKYELEALFGDHETCTDFKYIVRGVFTLLDGGEYPLKGRVPGSLEKETLANLLEKASRKAMQAVIAKYGA